MIRIALATAILAVTVGPVGAQVARLEIHPISSITLKEFRILGRSKVRTAEKAILAGELRIPKAGNDKLPAVVLLHGSGGIGGAGSMIDEWLRELSQIGIATLAVDSFAGRDRIDGGRPNATSQAATWSPMPTALSSCWPSIRGSTGCALL